MTLIDVADLRVSFETEDGTLNAVRGVSFTVNEGETFGIVGESGSGKSVCTQAIVGLLRGGTVTGHASLAGNDLLAMTPGQLRQVRGSKIGLVFQDPLSSLHPHFRVGAQIVEAIQAHERVPDRVARLRAIELLATVGLGQPDRRAEEYPHQFSGGMRQRAMIAMAVALRPSLIIADEPTTALDVTVQAQILELLQDLQAEHGTAIIMITHDLGVVAGMAERVMTMYAGEMVETAPRREIYYRPHHPYTRGLLDSVPSNNLPGEPLRAIPGQPPSLLNLGSGCVFRNRCSHAMAECEQDPPTRQLDGQHTSLCWLPASDAQVRSPIMLAARPSPDVSQRTTEPILRVTGVVKHFRRHTGLFDRRKEFVHAVDGVDLEVRRGETLGIVGESGCGKSTLARLITGLLPLTAGTVEFAGADLTNLPDKLMRPFRRDIQMIFQDPYGSLNPRRRVGSIIADPFIIHGLVSEGAGLRSQVQELMELVGLNPEHYNRFPSEFSGGQRQRIGIARALATRPKLIVCDEPVSALDVSIQAQIVNLLKRLQRELDLTYVFIGHDLSIVRHISDRTVVMYLGRMVELGQTEELFTSPRHPYTRALLSAAPIADPDAADLRKHSPLPGEVPSAVNPPEGCRFHPRCDRAEDICSVETPRLVTDTQLPRSAAACFFPITAISRREV